jgi:SNF2 family DNA or RNA helicase
VWVEPEFEFEMLSPAVRRFEVLFTKDGSKKRKVYNDGSLQILLKPSASNPPQSTSSSTHGHGSYSVILSDDNGKELFRKTLTEDQIKDFLPSNEITLNQYLVQIEKETDKIASVAEITSQQEIEEAKTPMNLLNTKKFLPKFPSKRLMSSKPNTVNTVASVAQQPMKLQIDASLLRVMREHQVEAADFIMNCFQSPPQEQDRDEDDDDFLIPRKHQPGTELMRGAILADDMGLGKTLTAISVLWTYIKGGKCKGLVICPSSLVENWEKEVCSLILLPSPFGPYS